MIRKKTSGVTLSIALATGLSSCYSVSAIDNKSNINNKILNGSHKDKSSSVKEQENAINRLMQTSKENLSPGEISYENKIRELEEVITQLTLATKAKINELENVKHSGEQANKQGTNPFAIVMYVTVSLAMITFLSSLLLILYKLKNAGLFEAINLIGSVIELIKETFEIKEDFSLEGLKEKLFTVKEILKDPQKYVYKEIKKLYSKLNGIELKNIVSLEEFKNEYESLLESNDGYTYKEASISKPVSKILDKIEKNIKPDHVPAGKVSKSKTHISDKWNEIPGSIAPESIRLNGKIKAIDPIFSKDIAYKAVLECLKKKKNKLENDNEECHKKINEIKKTKSEKEFNNRVIRKVNFLKRKENSKAFDNFYSEFEKIDKKIKNANLANVEAIRKNDKKKLEETKKTQAKTRGEYAFQLKVHELLDKKKVPEEVDTKEYETKISKLDKEIEENNKKILKIDILNSKLKREERTIIKIISEEKTLDSIFNKINDYIKKETTDDDFDEIVNLVNDYANALKEGNLINLISKQKLGKEELKGTIIPTLNLVKNVAILLNEKRKNLDKNEIVDIENQNTNLEVIIKNVTNLLAATEKTMKELHGKEISYTGFGSNTITLAGVADVLKSNYNNEINNM